MCSFKNSFSIWSTLRKYTLLKISWSQLVIWTLFTYSVFPHFLSSWRITCLFLTSFIIFSHLIIWAWFACSIDGDNLSWGTFIRSTLLLIWRWSCIVWTLLTLPILVHHFKITTLFVSPNWKYIFSYFSVNIAWSVTISSNNEFPLKPKSYFSTRFPNHLSKISCFMRKCWSSKIINFDFIIPCISHNVWIVKCIYILTSIFIQVFTAAWPIRLSSRY